MKSLHRIISSLLLLALVPVLEAADAKIRVVTTVGMVTDMVQNIGGDRVEVEGLMGPGVDPHLYKATTSDVSKLQKADMIFYSGLVLEGKMQDIFLKLARSKRFVYPVTESIPLDRLLEPAEFEGHYDPHVWFDVSLWSLSIDTVIRGLSEYSPKDGEYFRQKGEDYRLKLQQLHEWALQQIATLPKEKRHLVTSHDAFNYFGRAYGLEVMALQGISTVSEAGLADVAKLVDYIKSHQIKAIFIESSVSPQAIQRISKDSGAVIGGELFSDAMGTPGKMEKGYDVGTYEGMIKHNVNTIVEALK